MSAFNEDIRAQGAVLERVLAAYAGPDGERLVAARLLLGQHPTVVLTGMGSSLAAARTAVHRLASAGIPTSAHEAGELLHYGIDDLPQDALVVLVSQSGRSAETVALAHQIRRSGRARLVAVADDLASPLAQEADVCLPLYVDGEATVSTKTFVSSLVVVNLLADAIAGPREAFLEAARAARLPALVSSLGAQPGIAADAIKCLGGTETLVVVGRGPAYAAAEYGALILKETAAMPAEAMLGASFRHGPIELAGPRLGVIILAPDGATRALGLRLATDTAGWGSPTWVVTTGSGLQRIEAPGAVLTSLPPVPEPLAALPLAVTLQHFAAGLALARGREPGVLARASKVTTVE